MYDWEWEVEHRRRERGKKKEKRKRKQKRRKSVNFIKNGRLCCLVLSADKQHSRIWEREWETTVRLSANSVILSPSLTVCVCVCIIDINCHLSCLAQFLLLLLLFCSKRGEKRQKILFFLKVPSLTNWLYVITCLNLPCREMLPTSACEQSAGRQTPIWM